MRLLGVAVASILALLSVTACGSTGQSSSQRSSQSSGQSSAKPAATASPSTGGSAAAFYKGKTLTIIVPYSPGGGYDTFSRMLAHYIQKPLGVARVHVVNKSGGGGLVGSNVLATSKPDGLTIGATNGAGDVFDTIFHTKGMQFSAQKLDWLGRPDNEYYVAVFGPAGPGAPNGGYSSFAQLLQLKKSGKKVYVVSTGIGSSEYYGLIATLNAFGIPQHPVTGYKGSHDTKAGLLRGDGSVTEFGYGSLRTLILSHKVKSFAVQGLHRWSLLPKIPTFVELAQKDQVSATHIKDLKALAGILRMGHGFAAPPGVPAARLAFLEKAVQAAFTNPAFVAQANKEHRYPKFAPGSVLTQEVDAGVAAGADIRALVNGSSAG